MGKIILLTFVILVVVSIICFMLSLAFGAVVLQAVLPLTAVISVGIIIASMFGGGLG